MGSITPLKELPSSAEELERCLADPHWRIFSGCLYKIKIKGDDFLDDDGQLAAAELSSCHSSPMMHRSNF